MNKQVKETLMRIGLLLLNRFWSYIKSKFLKDFEHNPEFFRTSAFDKVDVRDYELEQVVWAWSLEI